MKTTAMTAEERVRYMTQAPVRRLILEMSAPTVISMLVTSFYNMADTLFVGQLDTQSGGGRRGLLGYGAAAGHQLFLWAWVGQLHFPPAGRTQL